MNNKINTLADLQTDKRNARRHTPRNIGMIENSIRQVGVARSGVIDENGLILAGNGTYEALAAAGIERVKVVEADGNEWVVVKRTGLTEEQKQLLALADNRTAELAEWDGSMLSALEIDLAPWFTDQELAKIGVDSGTEAQEGPDPQFDRAEALREQYGVKLGQIWELGEHRLMCGNATKADDVQHLMENVKARLVVTDPPYGVSYADKNTFLNMISPANRIEKCIENDHGSKEETQVMWKSAFREMSAVMDAGAVVYCFMPQGGDQMMMMMMMMEAGIEPRHEIIWLKNNHVLGRVDYAYKHEPILYAWKNGGHKFYGNFQTSILEFDKPQVSDLHPTMKPVLLICKLIENSSQSSEIIYDPFLGSGTTLIACEQLKRRCYAMEISEAYVAVSLDRWSRLTGKTPKLI